MDWLQLHDRFYRRIEFPKNESLPFSELESCSQVLLSAHCPNAGPVALYYKNSKTQASPYFLSIFSLSGKNIASLQLEPHDRIVSLEWIEGERLLCVMQNALVQIYGNGLISGQRPEFGIPSAQLISLDVLENSETVVVDGRISWTGEIAVLCSDLSFYFIPNINEHPNPRKYPTGGFLTDIPNDWQLFFPHKSSTSNSQPEILVCGERSILNFDGRDKIEYSLLSSYGPFQLIRVSSNRKLVALLDVNGRLLVVSADFEQILLEYQSMDQIPPPMDVAWCGSDSVCLIWEKQMRIVGPFGSSVSIWFDEPIVAFTECDGLRVFSVSGSEFIEKVPDSVEEVFKFGSTSSASLLLHAYELFEKNDPKADDIIRSIRPHLNEAVDLLIDAAVREFSTNDQKILLSAAAFGKAFLDYYSPEQYITLCKVLRVLNALRRADIGLPITYDQYIAAGSIEIIQRLCVRNFHLVAFRIAEALKISINPIANDWAAKKIQCSPGSMSDTDLAELIFEQIRKYNGIAIADIAKIAYKIGRPGLAARILDHEKSIAEQIPLLLKMQENGKALIRAVESGDADLLYTALMDLKRRLAAPDFFRMISEVPVASNLLIKYLLQRDPESLKAFFYQEDRRYENACLVLQLARKEPQPQDAILKMKSATRLLTGKKEYFFKLKAFEDEISLLEQQVELEKEFQGHQFVGLSVLATISKLIAVGKPNKALKIKNEFRVSEKSFWCTRISTLATNHDWEGLEKLAGSKRPPVGYGPFVDACFKNGNIIEAKKYISKADLRLRAELYIRLELFIEASEAAFEAKDIQILLELRDKYRNRAQLHDLERMINELRIK